MITEETATRRKKYRGNTERKETKNSTQNCHKQSNSPFCAAERPVSEEKHERELVNRAGFITKDPKISAYKHFLVALHSASLMRLKRKCSNRNCKNGIVTVTSVQSRNSTQFVTVNFPLQSSVSVRMYSSFDRSSTQGQNYDFNLLNYSVRIKHFPTHQHIFIRVIYK